MDRFSVRIQSLCATGSASAYFHNQKTVNTIFRRTALAEPVAHEKLDKKTSSYDIAIQRNRRPR